MNLKDKRKKAFLEYIETIYKIEEVLYAEKEKFLNVPSLFKVLNGNLDNLSTFDLIFASIHQMKDNYISTYYLLTEFLNKALLFNKKYNLGYIKEIDDVQDKIIEIKERVIELKSIPALDPYNKFKDADIKLVIEFYDEYANDIFELMLTLNINLSKYNFNYRKYFKDGFLKYIQKLNILIDFTSGSYNRIINMQTYHIMSSEEDSD